MHFVWQVSVSIFGAVWSYCAWRGGKEYWHQFRMWELHRQHPDKSIYAGRLRPNSKVHYFVGEEAYNKWMRSHGKLR